MKILNEYRVELAPTLQGHWYNVYDKKGKHMGIYPSSTTILNAYPQSEQLTKWIAENGWHESRQLRDEAGKRGTRIHQACEALEEGYTLQSTQFSLEEWYKISTFVSWFKETKPKLIQMEFPVFSKKGKYAGRLDRIYEIEGEIIILDLKSSSSLHEQFPLQFASYAKAIEENTDLEVAKTAVLQLGAKNKSGYRYVEYPNWKDHYKVFENVRAVWQYDYFDSKKNPKEAPVLILPETLSL